MRTIIDRFEGDYAVIELPDGSFVNAPKELFNGMSEGDIVDITINKHETKKKFEIVQNKFERLKKKE